MSRGRQGGPAHLLSPGDARISLYCAPLWALVLGVSCLVLKSRNPENTAFGKR